MTRRLAQKCISFLLLLALAGLADLYEGLGLGNLLSQFLAAADPEEAAALLGAAGFSPAAGFLEGCGV